MKAAILASLLLGCGGVVGQLPAVSSSQDLIEAYGAPISGDDCSATVFGVQTRSTSVRVALDAALSTRQHAVGVVVRDVEIRSVDRGIWIVGERCIHVEGRLAQ